MNTIKTIELFWSDIKYAIDQETWKSAKVQLFGDDKAELRSDAQVGQNTFDAHYCRRKVEEAVIGLEDVLRKFYVGYEAQPRTAENGGNNKLDTSSEKWEIIFSFDERRKVAAKQLAVEVSKYIVLYVLQEWVKMVMPTLKQEYYDRMVAEEEKLKDICYKKEAPEYVGMQSSNENDNGQRTTDNELDIIEIKDKITLEDIW